MLAAFAIAGICIVLLLDKAFRVLLNRTMRLLLRQRYHHYHIEARAYGVGTAAAVVRELQEPTLFRNTLVRVGRFVVEVGCFLLINEGVKYCFRRLEHRRLPAAHGNAEDMSETSWSSSRSSAAGTRFRDDQLLDYKLSSIPGSSGFAAPCRCRSRFRNELCPDVNAEFEDLFSACGQRSFTTFSRLFNSISLESGDRVEKIADGRNSEIFRVYAYTGDSVLKVQELDYVAESHDRLLHKIKIASRLSNLRNGHAYYTNGFVELKSVKCVFDSYPEKLLKAREREAKSPRNDARRARERDQTPRAYLVWHMSYAGVPLDEIELEHPVQLCSVFHQVALSLAVAEAALQFEHRALWRRRVFVKRHALAEAYTRFTIGGRSLRMLSKDVEVSVAGGASARLTDGTRRICRPVENDFHDTVERSVRSTNRIMEIIVRDDWRGFHPLTNLLWVHHVMKELLRRYEHKFTRSTDEIELAAWLMIDEWEEQLLEHTSLAEFVEKQCMRRRWPHQNFF
ncbi:hypothetical protein MTO96_005227 [Rhipicephalus appendiculatus]